MQTPVFTDPKLEERFDHEYRACPLGYYRALAISVLGFLVLISITGLVIDFSINAEGIQKLLWLGLIPVTAMASVGLFLPGLKDNPRIIVIAYVVAIIAICALYPRIKGDPDLGDSYGFSYLAFAIFLVLAFARLSTLYALVAVMASASLYVAVTLDWLGIDVVYQHITLLAGPAALGLAVGYQAERNARGMFAARAEVEDRERRLAESEAKLMLEQEKSETLILSMLPESIARRLKEEGKSIADGIVECTVLFADLVGFTRLAETMGPRALVRLLNDLFSIFDDLCSKHGVEKIKTIGDAYMAAAGVPDYIENHPAAAADMALDMLQAVQDFNDQHQTKLDIRIGIHTGPVIAGIIGTQKFAYDLWGDAVNMAARLESHGEAGRIQVSDATASQLQKTHELNERGYVDVKGKGSIRTYWLCGRQEAT